MSSVVTSLWITEEGHRWMEDVSMGFDPWLLSQWMAQVYFP